MPRVPQNFSEFFFVHYLGTGEPFSMSGRAQKPIGPKKVLRCISLGPAFIFLAINQTHLRLAFCCSTKLFSYPTEAIFWITWSNIVKRMLVVEWGTHKVNNVALKNRALGGTQWPVSHGLGQNFDGGAGSRCPSLFSTGYGAHQGKKSLGFWVPMCFLY